MSTEQLKAAVTGTAPPAGTDLTTGEIPASATIAGILTNPKFKQQLALAMPKHMTADRLARIALNEVRRVPKLAQCNQASFLGAIMQLGALGLEPGGALGHAYLLPFDKKAQVNGKWTVVDTEVQLIIGYRGMIDLARRSGQILSLEARAVYAKDTFSVELGLDSNITHQPAWTETDRGPLTFAYAVAKLRDGGTQFDVMSRAEIERIRARSKAKDSGPWITDFDEMAKKTVVRRLFKYLPVSIEIQHAVGLDEQAELGISQDNAGILAGDFSRVAAPDPQRQALEAPITLEEVLAGIRGAASLEELDAAVDLSRMLPDGGGEAVKEEHRARRVALTST